ncbi:rust resistance kinase Lr10-like [Salvia divinorum]|uniref:Rust resistance kinase Lr10-like n=1 Tax=Salvia divinorum TaxID=28513 RepID=A0ABD1FJY9_SALDI
MMEYSYLLIVWFSFLPSCHANCPGPSACGIFANISSPFRLTNDSNKCGDRRFELACEDNVTYLSLNSHKYYVKAINYSSNDNHDTSTVRLVDVSINSDDICSFPSVSAYEYQFSSDNPNRPPFLTPNSFSLTPTHLHLMRCPRPLQNSSLFTDITSRCTSGSGYTYIRVGRLMAPYVKPMCRVEVIVMTAWDFKESDNVSLSEIHDSLLYGFELNVCPWCTSTDNLWDKFVIFLYSLVPILLVITCLLCAGLIPPITTIIGFVAILGLLAFTGFLMVYSKIGETIQLTTAFVSTIIICVPRFIIFPMAVWLLIYKFRRRHLSMYNTIESFLQSDNKITSIRYSYSDIKKMTRNFQEKLGQGGYGSVYKGKLLSGNHVAVKMLGKSGGNGQDFMNEIATIGRIHHVNVVTLVGYCAEGSKRALVLDFMPNGSLDKYLFNREKMDSINWDTKFNIAVGIARGIEYLHRGCDIQILHFDIKPHNILLDDKFIPKISDFGLAKYCSTDKNTVTMTAARGTIGYVAPELISRSIGAVSYKADVYSFGMLLMEMVGLNRDLRVHNGESSQYFPNWIYECFAQGKDIEVEKTNENEDGEGTRKLVRKMTIVALWCIQMSPDDRPSMNKVVQMLEGDVERLQIPDSPSQSAQTVINVDQIETTCFTDTVSLLHHDDDEIYVQE